MTSAANNGTYTIKVSGMCGLTSNSVTIVITNSDNTPPTIICPPDLLVQCYKVPPPNTNSVVATDSSGFAVVMFLGDTAVTNNCRITITRTYKATDACGNTNFCRQIITVLDTIAPTLICAPDFIVECGIPCDFSPPVVVDNCVTNPTLRIVGTVTNAGQCPIKSVAIRTWEAYDSCNNTSRCAQTITLIDTEAPELLCAPNFTVECGSDWNFKRPIAFDLCQGTNVNIRIVGTVTNPGPCAGTLTATRTWDAIDICSNVSAQCSQTVTVVDTLPPVIACAPNTVVQCGTPWNFTRPSASDLCSGTNVQIRIVSTMTNAGVCPAIIVATRTWEALDLCSNVSAQCSQTITVIETTSVAHLSAGVHRPVRHQRPSLPDQSGRIPRGRRDSLGPVLDEPDLSLRG